MSETLTSIEVNSVKKELEAPDLEAKADSELVSQADDIVSRLIKISPNDHKGQSEAVLAIENMSSKIQLEASRKSAMLKEPIHKLSRRTEDGGPVANALIDLKMTVEEIDPGKFDFSEGWAVKWVGFLPFVGKPIKKYFSKYQSASVTIDAIVKSLEDGREVLKRDNITLAADQAAMRDLTFKLQRSIELGRLIDEKLTSYLETELPTDDPRYRFMSEELLFPLRQRITDIQQQLAVNQQGILTIEIIMRNNKELTRGVNRALNVTINALQVAVTLALALANQKIVLEKIQAVNKTTDELIANTSKALRQQGTQIHKMASSTSLNIDTLKQSFIDIHAALEDISSFRKNALPQMAQTIIELDELTTKSEKAIVKMEEAKVQTLNFSIEAL